jgi:hypothetical protein
LTTNGKLDVKALPPPAVTAVNGDAGDGLTTGLSELWGSVFGVPVGPDDNFFELGGNSMYAIRIRTAMRDRGMPAVPLQQIYRAPTPRQLAQALGGNGVPA